jgi:gas vesicle protein
MGQNTIPKGNYFLVGLGIGSLIGVLFAPKSGEEAREFISKKVREGNELALKNAQAARAHAAETVDVGIETYNHEKSKAQVC